MIYVYFLTLRNFPFIAISFSSRGIKKRVDTDKKVELRADDMDGGGRKIIIKKFSDHFGTINWWYCIESFPHGSGGGVKASILVEKKLLHSING